MQRNARVKPTDRQSRRGISSCDDTVCWRKAGLPSRPVCCVPSFRDGGVTPRSWFSVSLGLWVFNNVQQIVKSGGNFASDGIFFFRHVVEHSLPIACDNRTQHTGAAVAKSIAPLGDTTAALRWPVFPTRRLPAPVRAHSRSVSPPTRTYVDDSPTFSGKGGYPHKVSLKKTPANRATLSI